MLCEGCLSDEGTCTPTSDSFFGPNPMYVKTPIRKQTLVLNLLPFFLRGNISIYYIDYYIQSILSLCTCLYILYYLLPIACLHCIAEESLGAGWMELLFCNWVFLIGKFVDTCVRFINAFVRFVRKLGYGRDICLFKIHLVTTSAPNLFSISAYEKSFSYVSKSHFNFL